MSRTEIVQTFQQNAYFPPHRSMMLITVGRKSLNCCKSQRKLKEKCTSLYALKLMPPTYLKIYLLAAFWFLVPVKYTFMFAARN